MEYLKKNYRTIIICLLLIIGAFFVSLLNKNSQRRIDNTQIIERNHYEINEVIPLYITEEDIAKKYLAEYIFLLNVDLKNAYELLSQESKEKYPTIKSFEKYIDTLRKNHTMMGSVKKYAYNVKNGHRQMNVIDNNGNTWVFIEESIMDYRVTIN